MWERINVFTEGNVIMDWYFDQKFGLVLKLQILYDSDFHFTKR